MPTMPSRFPSVAALVASEDLASMAVKFLLSVFFFLPEVLWDWSGNDQKRNDLAQESFLGQAKPEGGPPPSPRLPIDDAGKLQSFAKHYRGGSAGLFPTARGNSTAVSFLRG